MYFPCTLPFPSPFLSILSRASLARDPAFVHSMLAQKAMGDKSTTLPTLLILGFPTHFLLSLHFGPYLILPIIPFPKDTGPRWELHPMNVLMGLSKPTPAPSDSVCPRGIAFIGLSIYFETGSFLMAQAGLKLSTFQP